MDWGHSARPPIVTNLRWTGHSPGLDDRATRLPRFIGDSELRTVKWELKLGTVPSATVAIPARETAVIRRLAIFLSLLGFVAPPAARSQQPWFFAVLSDPQFGMYAKDRNFAQESANFAFAIATLNRLHPRFVVICGDLVNRTGDAAEIAEYKRILGQLAPSIPVYPVAGNHDVGNTPTPETIAGYRSAIGRDYYTFSSGSILGIVLDSSLMAWPAKDPEGAQQQDAWLKKTLADAKLDQAGLDGTKTDAARQIVVFQHIPYFLHNAGEPDDYFNFPQSVRRKYLDLIEQAGVRTVFAGHYHRNAGGTDGSVTERVVGAVGMPIPPALSGFEIVSVNGQKLDSRWYCLAALPNQIDPGNLPPTTCPQ